MLVLCNIEWNILFCRTVYHLLIILFLLSCSTPVQDSSLEIFFTGQNTLLEREFIGHEQSSVFSLQGHNRPFQHSRQAFGLSFHVLFLQQPQILLSRQLRSFALPCILCDWHGLRIRPLART